jgi:hypothetical protein
LRENKPRGRLRFYTASLAAVTTFEASRGGLWKHGLIGRQCWWTYAGTESRQKDRPHPALTLPQRMLCISQHWQRRQLLQSQVTASAGKWHWLWRKLVE